jgi:hypothetical protein
MTSVSSSPTAPSVLAMHVPIAAGTGRLRVGAILGAGAGVAFAVTVVGGYAGRWGWTGYAANGTVWDWLHLLLLPLSVSALPVWWRAQPAVRRHLHRGAGCLAVVLAVLVVGGYGWGWSWTGFAGNRLWEWLSLLLIPVALALVPLWIKTRHTRRSLWLAGLVGGAATLVVLMIGGYALGWTWTGFAGNRLWDWIHLLLVPAVLPATVAWWDDRQRETRMLRAAADRYRARPEWQNSFPQQPLHPEK